MNFVPLGSIAEIQLGKMLSPAAKTGLYQSTYLRNQNVQWGRFDLSDLATMDFSERERQKFELHPGDLLICEGGEPGRCAVWNGELADCYYQKALHRLRPYTGIADSEFLAYWIRSQALKGTFEDQNAKTTIAHLPLVRLEQLPVPDLPLEEQRRIASLIKSQLAAVEDARQAVQTQLKEAALLANKLRDQAMMDLDAFRRVRLEDLLQCIDAGKSFQTSERLASERELGVLKVSAVSWGEFKPGEAKAIDGDYTPDDRHRIRKGDVIVSRANTIALVGAVVRAERDYPQRLLSDKTLRLILDTMQCDPDYFVEALRLPEARAHIEANATGSSDSMRNISQGALAATPIPLPEIHEQRRLAKHMQAVNQELTALRASIQTRLDHIEQLPARLLAQVFDAL
ncbi:restriction endonuclease subunit S [uncultured Zoogloea sp.]|uniref:restriction endonuclease subunit S n=1 Tax=uncultured Zoogloea sp. TaxID=160237 RepID=UPI0026357113|nr:restriction endonuclease subunit S [uncultured Zoogloea sp.]